jgi:hypothetical protein
MAIYVGGAYIGGAFGTGRRPNWSMMSRARQDRRAEPYLLRSDLFCTDG